MEDSPTTIGSLLLLMPVGAVGGAKGQGHDIFPAVHFPFFHTSTVSPEAVLPVGRSMVCVNVPLPPMTKPVELDTAGAVLLSGGVAHVPSPRKKVPGAAPAGSLATVTALSAILALVTAPLAIVAVLLAAGIDTSPVMAALAKVYGLASVPLPERTRVMSVALTTSFPTMVSLERIFCNVVLKSFQVILPGDTLFKSRQPAPSQYW